MDLARRRDALRPQRRLRPLLGASPRSRWRLRHRNHRDAGSIPMTGWTYSEVWDHIAGLVPDAPALVHGETRRTWGEFEARASGVATTLLEEGLRHQDAVAQYLYNGNEYLESFYACLKAGLMPVNTNY